jgi:uncharacterized membrane protein
MTAAATATAGAVAAPTDAGEPAAPSRQDSLVRAASEAVGGPAGDHAAPHPWWTPVRVVLAVATLALALGLVQKGPCVATDWQDGELRYGAMCYSDVPYLYSGRGFAELTPPYSESPGEAGRYPALEYPVLTGWFAYGAAVLTQAVVGGADLEHRASLPPDQVYGAPGVVEESGAYFLLTAVLLAVPGLAAAWFLARAQRGRPWDAMGYAAAPALVLAAFVNWDLLAVAAVAAALWAWSRDRPVLTGVLVGLGTAAKLYPLLLLGAVIVICLRERRLAVLARTVLAAAAAWLVVNLPVMVAAWDRWVAFWSFNSDRGADLGSLWLVAQRAGWSFPAEQINQVSLVVLAAWCTLVLLLGLTAPRTPRFAQLAFLVVAGFLLVNKVYSPQYVLWLLPLAALARPRWRDLLVWQAGEAFYFAAVWLHLAELTASSVSGGEDRFYSVAIVVRVVAQLYLVWRVVVDVRRPELDPVLPDRHDPGPDREGVGHARTDDGPGQGLHARRDGASRPHP